MPLLDKATLEAITRQVARRFPEVQEVRPTIRRHSHEGRLLVIYRLEAVTADGRRFIQRVRVVADKQGKIYKMTTTH